MYMVFSPDLRFRLMVFICLAAGSLDESCLSKQDTEGFYILGGGGEEEYEYQVGSMDGSGCLCSPSSEI